MTWQQIVPIAVAVFAAGCALGWWARGAHNRAGVAVVHETDARPRGWRVYLRRVPIGPQRAFQDAAQADAERLEGEL